MIKFRNPEINLQQIAIAIKAHQAPQSQCTTKEADKRILYSFSQRKRARRAGDARGVETPVKPASQMSAHTRVSK